MLKITIYHYKIKEINTKYTNENKEITHKSKKNQTINNKSKKIK